MSSTYTIERVPGSPDIVRVWGCVCGAKLDPNHEFGFSVETEEAVVKFQLCRQCVEKYDGRKVSNKLWGKKAFRRVLMVKLAQITRERNESGETL